jgi:hypothetical protein
MKTLDLDLQVTAANESPVGADGFALFAPYGDAENVFAIDNPKAFLARFPDVKFVEAGGVTRIDAIQRITAANSKPMAERFHSALGTVKRWFKGAPVFYRHPDHPGSTAGDARPLGVVTALDAREDGLFGVPYFTADGATAVNSKEKLFFSPRFRFLPTGVENGKLVMEPTDFLSVGITPEPNLAADAVNEAAASAANSSPSTMNKTLLMPAILSLGINLPADASDEAIATEIRAVGSRLNSGATAANERDTLKTENDRLKAELDTLKSTAANEAKTTREAAINAAIRDGRITEADRALWDGILTASAANGIAALGKLERKVKTERVNAETTAANEKTEKRGFDRALAATQKALAGIDKVEEAAA